MSEIIFNLPTIHMIEVKENALNNKVTNVYRSLNLWKYYGYKLHNKLENNSNMHLIKGLDFEI